MVLASVGMILASSGCGPCGPDEYFWQHISGRSLDMVVSGQGDPYPLRPEVAGYSVRPSYQGWKDHLEFIRNPKVAATVIVGGIGFVHCEPPDENPPLNCGELTMSQAIAGPKSVGEVYQVQHFDIPPGVPEPPAVYLNWNAKKYYVDTGGFPEYHSVAVTGTAEVLAVHPFRMAYDVNFFDAGGNQVNVQGNFLLEYWEGCGLIPD